MSLDVRTTSVERHKSIQLFVNSDLKEDTDAEYPMVWGSLNTRESFVGLLLYGMKGNKQSGIRKRATLTWSVDIQQFGQVLRTCTSDVRETRGQFTMYSLGNRKPVKGAKKR